MTKRTAVDSTAKSYWETYYGDFGKAWVKEIKHRVMAALHAPPDATIVPSSGHTTAAGGVVLEGFLRTRSGDRIFRAELNSDGKVIGLEHDALPKRAAGSTASPRRAGA